MCTQELIHWSPVYAVWFGKPVVLVVAVRQYQIPMPCSIVGESLSDVRVCLDPGWEMDLPKQLILAVEEDAASVPTRYTSIQYTPANKIN